MEKPSKILSSFFYLLKMAAVFAVLILSTGNHSDIFAVAPKKETISGKYVKHLADIFPQDISEIYHEVIEANGKKTRIYLTDDESEFPNLKHGSQISIDGIRDKKGIAVDVKDIRGEVARDEPPLQNGKVTTLTMRNTLVLKVNFNDASVSCSVNSINDAMFTNTLSSNQYLQKASHGMFGLSGIVDTVSIPHNINGPLIPCEYDTVWAPAADFAATQLGYNINQYQHIVYVIPPSPNLCDWSGMSDGVNIRTWARGYCDDQFLFSHEIGHNLGYGHSRDDAIPASNYADTSDLMGCCVSTEFTGPHRYQTGYTPANKVLNAPHTNASYQLSPLSDLPTSVPYKQVIRIAKNNGSYIYLSFRKGTPPWDHYLWTTYIDKLNIHRMGGGQWPDSWFEKGLAGGQTFVDPDPGVRFNNVSVSTNSISFNVTFDTAGTPPTNVAITSPANGTIIPVDTSVKINTQAFDNMGVNQVKFFKDGVLWKTRTWPTPFHVYWKPTTPGTNSFYIRAFDGVGNSKASSAITVTAIEPSQSTPM